MPASQLTDNTRFRRGGRPTNAAMGRTREHLTHAEAEALIAAAGKTGRNRLRDRTLCLMLYRHGLRISEAVQLQWSQIDMANASMHVKRLKNGQSAGHPLQKDTLEALKALRPGTEVAKYVFTTERGTPLDRINAGRIVRRAGKVAGLPFRAHPHMLRHATGYYLANEGHDLRLIQDFLGHRNIQHTVLYTRLAPGRFDGLW
ncbi:tyrosine-type recombinase/integrase [Lentisalinibacter salinarum]|uniref:tyrosine-type recombinase/integrase n=1 Tax=Lentisalinibacter salinarum TaxID=2992239 RepID=UPI003870B409